MKLLGQFVVYFLILLSCSDLSGQNISMELLPSSETGIAFENRIVEDLKTEENLFDYDYFYNGAGVGILDVNNDGLQDIYFAANQVENRLYLNEGSFHFRDVTASAFGSVSTSWSSGVSIVDINGDGWQDIYVCQGGPHSATERKNLLWVNNQDNTFTESASAYGLDDMGISTQAVFFDFDKDGDQDCFVMNESIAYGIDPVAFTRLHLERKRDLYVSLSHMYINEGGTFVDKTKELGLDKPTFGLGIAISDFNSDGWEDIYIANDYYVPDMMLINQRGTGFKDEIKVYLNQMSFYGMGLDIADINNDGQSDICVLDMASGDHYRAKTLMRSMNVDNFRLLVEGLELPHQYMYNSLQVASGEQRYSNLSHFFGVSSTDWSWSALMEDFDFDGFKDLHVTNGYRRYALDNDFQAKIREAKAKYANAVPLDVKEELYGMMPTEKLQNVFFHNSKGIKFEQMDLNQVVNPPSYSNGAAVADLDNDGDVDLVINNLDGEAFIYRNLVADQQENNFITLKSSPDGHSSIKRVRIDRGKDVLMFEPRKVRGYLSSSEASVFVGIGKDATSGTIEVLWSDGTMSLYNDLEINKVHFLGPNDGTTIKDMASVDRKSEAQNGYFDEIIPESVGLDYWHSENDYDDFEKETLLPYKQSTLGPYVTSADIDGDGLDDVIFSNAKGGIVRAFSQTNRGFKELTLGDSLSADIESGKISVADIDQDGHADVLIPASGNENVDGDDDYRSQIVYNKNTDFLGRSQLPLSSGSASRIVAIDFDKDGDQDLIECKRHVAQKYPMHAPSHFYENTGSGFVDRTASVFPDLASFGLINDMIVIDLDGDGYDDIVVVGEWTDIRFYRNVNGVFDNVSADYGLPSLKGLWFTIKDVNLNDDGRVDFIVGNLGKNSKYKATVDKPLKIYGHDFDSNGSWDLVLSKEYKDQYVPFRGLECSSAQMPFIRNKFKTYDLFAKATITDVYGSKLDSAYYRYVETLNSIALVSNADGKYDVVDLPPQAQTAPVLSISSLDVNGDGREDVILAGNIYDTEVETPRLDSGHGLILINTDEDGSFKTLNMKESGLDLGGNIKSVTSLYHKGGDCKMIIATENNGPVKVFTLRK